MTLLEVVLAIAVATVVLIASAGAFSASVAGVVQARHMGRAATFLETVMEDLSAQAYADLPSFNGNQIFNRTNAADSEFSVTLTVFLTQVNLVQVRATITDLRSGEVLGELVTLRSNR